MKPVRFQMFAIAVFAMGQVNAATINMNGDDAAGTTSFNSGLHWVGGAVPAAGNAYQNANFLLRTPAVGSTPYTFAGDSLLITSDSAIGVNLNDALMFKGGGATGNTITVNNLTINGGNLRHASGDADTFTLAGNSLTVGASGMGVHMQGPTIVTAPVGGSGTIRIVDNGSTAAGRVLHFNNAANTFSGNVELPTANRSRFQVDAGSNFKFVIGANGVNNTITGAGTAAFNGSFTIDLTSAATTVGSSWTLVAATTLAETYDAAFTIPSFTSDAGTAGARLWTKAIGGTTFYRYNEATGVLSVIQTDSDGDGLSDLWEDQYFGNHDGTATPEELALQSGTDDFDGDGANNLAEQVAGTNPTNAGSWPDADADGLKDAWEITWFANITSQGAAGDADGDLLSNLAEFTAGTIPSDASSWVDSDSDAMNDAWETLFFGNLSKDGSADSDVDAFTDYEEYEAHTNPNNVALSPVTATLRNRWSFNGNLTDSVGGSDATIVDVGANDVAYNNGGTPTAITMTGGARTASDYVRLGTNLLPNVTTPVTLELWATNNTIQNWSRIFDFNNGTEEYAMMSWTRDVTLAFDRSVLRDTRPDGTAGEDGFSDRNAPYTLGTEYHIVMVIEPLVGSGGRTRVTFYSAPSAAGDLGSVKGTFETSINLINLTDSLCALGYSPFTGDSTASATYNEFRIWNGPLAKWVREKLHDQGPDNAAIPDTDHDFLPDDWEYAWFPGNLAALTALGAADYDGDSISNRDEYIAGSAPNNALSTPNDTDGDGLEDYWEAFYFTNWPTAGQANPLRFSGTDDPDLDGLTNEEEETGGSDPASDDVDGDSLSDNWEKLYFTNWPTPGQPDPRRFIGTDDPDGDTFSNEAEETAGSNPTLAASIPGDIDGDGLLDTWEEKYFGNNNGVATPAELALQSGTGDPDSDGYNNEAEETAKSDPTVTASIPGDINADGIPDGFIFTTADPLGTASFNSGTGWQGGAAPAAGNNYLVPIQTLRTPADTANYTFAGDKLVITTGGSLVVKGTGVLTIPYLGLDGGFINNATNANAVITLEGAFRVTRASDLWANNNSIIVNAVISGSQQLNITRSGTTNTVTLAGANTLTGNVNVTGGLVLGSTGSLTFKPGASGVNNAITGTGTAVLDGAFNIDLSTAGTTSGNNWDLVTTTGAVTYGVTFAVTGFTADAAAVGARKWTSGNYQFDETNGVLTRIGGGNDSDTDGMDDTWETTYFGGLGQVATGDFDGDGTSNLTEYRLGLIPNSGSSLFRAVRAANGLITWPSAVGLKFDVQRSTSLGAGSWTTISPVGGIDGAAGTTSFTDPSAPVGQAFYKVVLRP